MQHLVFFLSWLVLRHIYIVAIEIQVVEFLQETIDTSQSLSIPRLTLLKRTQKHLVETQTVGAILFADFIRIHNVIFGLGHFLHFTLGYVLPIFQNKFSICKLGTPLSECIGIQFVRCSFQKGYININLLCFLITDNIPGNKSVGSCYPKHTCTHSQNHPLVNQLFERFFMADIASVLQEHIPETGVKQMAGRMFASSYVQIYLAPVI